MIQASEKFVTVVADPPWPYEGGGPVGNGGRGKAEGFDKIVQVGLKQHYGTMTIDDLKALPVKQSVAKNAHLYLWLTNGFVEEAYHIARAWGFAPKTLVTWGKVKKDDPTTPSMKTGYYYRGATEHFLFCVRGSLRLQGPCRPTLFLEPRSKHSVKPDRFYDLIEEQSPGPYLELFARRPRAGWSVWGNQVDSSAVLSDRFSAAA